MGRLLACESPRVVDVGCGGGTYCLAWLGVGAASVVGVDFSQANLRGAAQRCGEVPGLSWQLGDAVDTGLAGGCADVVFQRALIHHLPDLGAAFTEARRLLTPGGQLIVADRTMADVLAAGLSVAPAGVLLHRVPRGWSTSNANGDPTRWRSSKGSGQPVSRT